LKSTVQGGFHLNNIWYVISLLRLPSTAHHPQRQIEEEETCPGRLLRLWMIAVTKMLVICVCWYLLVLVGLRPFGYEPAFLRMSNETMPVRLASERRVLQLVAVATA